jgi:uncharacterized membrane-anchored protein YitT (DUF2179 family)
MRSFLRNLAENFLKSKRDKARLPVDEYEDEVRKVPVEFSHRSKEIFLVILGVFSAAFGLKGFLLPNMFIDGGVMGISLIIAEISKIPLSILVFVVNVPFIILGVSSISKQFALKSILAIMFLAVIVHFVNFPAVTSDKLLISVFGGFFLGLGIGLSIRGGAVIDGTEVLAVYLSRKTPLTIGDIIMLFNVLIFLVAAYVFSVETALYAMLTYLAASKTIDFVVSGIEEYVGVSIISEKSDEIRKAILENLGRGCTIYKGKKGNSLEEVDIVYTLVTRMELAKLSTEIDKLDEEAFVIMHSIKDAKGGMIKKRPLK